jgi:2-(1,2-epoxy-1,2-dihydrophenyl)acetyl-CoA isomerase
MSEPLKVDTGSPKILFEIDQWVAIVTLNDPENRNPVGDDTRSALRRSIDRIVHDDEIRCLLLTGAGDAFCAGA